MALIKLSNITGCEVLINGQNQFYVTYALPVPKMTGQWRNGQNMRVGVMADKLSLT